MGLRKQVSLGRVARSLRSLSRAEAAAMGEVLAGEPNGDRALADGGSDAFHRAAAHVADGEHPWQAAFDQVRIPAKFLRLCALPTMPGAIHPSDERSAMSTSN